MMWPCSSPNIYRDVFSLTSHCMTETKPITTCNSSKYMGLGELKVRNYLPKRGCYVPVISSRSPFCWSWLFQAHKSIAFVSLLLLLSISQALARSNSKSLKCNFGVFSMYVLVFITSWTHSHHLRSPPVLRARFSSSESPGHVTTLKSCSFSSWKFHCINWRKIIKN